MSENFQCFKINKLKFLLDCSIIICHGHFQECCLTLFRLCAKFCAYLRLLPNQSKSMSTMSDFKPENVWKKSPKSAVLPSPFEFPRRAFQKQSM